MSPLPDTRFSLIARLAEPTDAKAWSEFVLTYEQAIFRYSKSHGLQDADAWEVVQQVLLAVHQQAGGWESSGRAGSFRCWLMRTAHRICLRSLRESRHCDRASSPSSEPIAVNGAQRGPGGASHPAYEDQRDWQRWAFCWAVGFVEHEVDQKTWQAFRMTAVDGVSASETARVLGLKVGSVYTARCRIIARIRELVQSLPKADTYENL